MYWGYVCTKMYWLCIIALRFSMCESVHRYSETEIQWTRLNFVLKVVRVVYLL